MAKNNLLPDFSFRYFNQNLFGIDPGYKGYSIGIGVPIAFWSYTAQIKAAETQKQIALVNYENESIQFISALAQLNLQYEIANTTVQYLESTGLTQAEEILRTAKTAYSAGEIGYFELIFANEEYFNRQFNYLQALEDLNQTIININYFINK